MVGLRSPDRTSRKVGLTFSPVLLFCKPCTLVYLLRHRFCYLSLGTRIFALYPASERQESNLRLLITSEAFTISATLRYAPYPQRRILLPHCQTAAFSAFSLCRFSGYLKEEDSFYCQQTSHVYNDITFQHYPVALLTAFGKLYPSGLTWEDTTAAERLDLNQHYANFCPPVCQLTYVPRLFMALYAHRVSLWDL